MNLRILYFLIFIFSAAISCKTALTVEEKAIKKSLFQARKTQAKAETAIESENFKQALGYMLSIDSLSKHDPTIPFGIGLCYYQLKQYSKAHSYFKQALSFPQKENIPIDTYFYKGLTCYKLNREDSALKVYDKLRDSVEKLGDEHFLETINKEIKRCEELINLKKTPVTWEVHNLSGDINSKFDDHSPVISADESVLIFTSKRAGKKVEGKNEYYEDIYISKKVDSVWTKPVSISDSINTDDHEASIGLSADGQHLLIYRAEEKGSIYQSTLEGDVWGKPQKLGSNINSSSRESHASMSADGKYLYFTSDRSGGEGGMDIYVSERQSDGTWGKAENLGYGVNTPEDEESPFIHPNGKTLYFSSKGHNSIGGFDIFQTEKNIFGTWTRPTNMGYPVNTVNDDVFFVLSPDGRRAYYASVNEKKKVTDILMGNMPDVKEIPLTVMKGQIKVPCGELPPINITINDAETDEIIGIYAPNTKTGKFIFFLSRGKEYHIAVEANDEEVLIDTLAVSAEAKFEEIYKTIEVPPLEPCAKTDTLARTVEVKKNVDKKIKFDGDQVLYDEAIAIRNILFPSGQTRITKNLSLDRLSSYLQNNPNAVVEIGGHSDSKGNKQVNYRVARKRALAAKNYLIRKGVKSKQLKVVSYGPSKPIALNKDKKGRWIPQAMKFNRRIDFKVLKQGKKTLKILPIDLVPEKWRM